MSNIFGKKIEPPAPEPDYDFTSTLGIRATWSCARCPNSETTYQVAHVATVHGIAAPIVKVDPPQNWTVQENATYCPIHSVRGARG